MKSDVNVPQGGARVRGGPWLTAPPLAPSYSELAASAHVLALGLKDVSITLPGGFE